MICSTLTPNRSGKENPCYTQIRLQKIRILEIRELHNGWLQCGLTVYGVETLPSNAFSNCQPLKSINLPEVKRIDRSAFQSCNSLETIYAPRVSFINDVAFSDCHRLISVTLGNISTAGFRIFDVGSTDFVDLTLSKDQKVMTGSDYEGWKSDESEKYANSPDHVQRQFLGKIFKSIKCGSKIY